MRSLYWDRLDSIRKTEKPYKKSTNRFPIGSRRHNLKCFYVEQRDGEEVFIITYGYNHKSHERTKEEFLEDSKNNLKTIYEEDRGDGVIKYHSYSLIPRELGIVRNDNTFEFTATGCGQGDKHILSYWGRGSFFNSSRHGGMVYSEYSNSNLFLPIFKNMRIHLDTMMPHESSQYKVYGKRVNRKQSKQYLLPFENFYKTNEAMFKVISNDGLIETIKDIFKQYINQNEEGKYNYYLSNQETERLKEVAHSLINEAPIDSAILYCFIYDISNIYYRTRSCLNSSNPNYYYNTDPTSLFNSLKRKLNKELFRSNPEVFKTIEYEPNKRYPASEWGITILCNGKEVEQY